MNDFTRFQLSREKHFRGKFHKALNRQVDAFLEAYGNGQTLTNALMKVNGAEISMLIRAVKYDAGKVWGWKVYDKLPKKIEKKRPVMGWAPFIISLMESYYASEILSTSEGITDTTREFIQHMLIQATRDGVPLEQQATMLKKEINRTRARLISRTETTTAANQAGYVGAMQAGIKLNKKWGSIIDKRTRHDHRNMRNVEVGMDDYFDVGNPKQGFVTMLFPGARIQKDNLPVPAREVCNCRCWVDYVPQRKDGRVIAHTYDITSSASRLIFPL